MNTIRNFIAATLRRLADKIAPLEGGPRPVPPK